MGVSRAIAAGQPWRFCARPVALAAIAFGLCFLTGELFFPMFAAAFALVVAAGEAMDGDRAEPRRGFLPSWSWRMALASGCAFLLAAGLAAMVPVPAAGAAKAATRPWVRGAS